MEFWNLYRIVRKRLWMVMFLIVVTVASTMVTVLTRPPTYKSASSVRVAIASPAVADVGRLDWYTAGILFSTIQETILSRTILQEVIDTHRLGLRPDDFRRAVGVDRVGNSNLLRIEVKSTEAEMAKRLANDIAVTFIKFNQNLLDTQSASSIQYYEEQVKQAEQNYNAARDDFRDSLNQPNARAAENRFITAQGAYQSSLDKLEAVRLINRFPDLRPASVTMAEPAVTPTEPEGRQLARYLLIALLVSLLLGVFIALGIEYLDLSIKAPSEVTSELGLVVLGAIPHFRRGISGVVVVLSHLDLPLLTPLIHWRMRGLESNILPPSEVPFESHEAFRTARVGLLTTHRQRAREGYTGASTVLITSSRPRDGKTTVTVHLGVALGKAGCRVLVVDADFRNSELYLHASVDPEGPGLVQVLQEEASLEQAIKPTPYPNLSVILCGAHDPSHPELLDTDRFSDLLVALGQAYDFILVDSPAVGVFTDAAVLAARLGRVMLVVDATRSGPENERRSLTLLRRTGAAVEGVIVNKISAEYVDPMRLHSLPRHVVDLTHSFGNGNGNGNGHTNGHTNGYANGNGAATNGHVHPAGGPVPPVPEHN